jgi:hypothetical protein
MQLSFRIGVHHQSCYIKIMKSAGTLIIAVTLLFSAGARAQDTAVADAAAPVAAASDAAASDAAASDSPYASIVSRNMFGLLPIPVVNPEDNKPPPEPPPKITPNGIMTIFGRLQALFKVATKPKPGQPAKDDSYVLAEGERQADVEVVKIDQPNGIITFNNHGTIQELSLVAAKGTTSAGPGGPGAGINPGMRPPGSMAAGALSPAQIAAMRRPSPPGRNMSPTSPPSVPNIGNNAGGSNPNSAGMANVNANGIYQPQNDPTDTMSPEQRAFLIETQRKVYQQQGNPIANLLPPTRADVQQMVQQLDGQQ